MGVGEPRWRALNSAARAELATCRSAADSASTAESSAVAAVSSAVRAPQLSLRLRVRKPQVLELRTPLPRKGLLVRHQLVELGGYLGLFLEDTLVLVNLDVVRRLVAHALRL